LQIIALLAPTAPIHVESTTSAENTENPTESPVLSDNISEVPEDENP
jgi:hypothetical protein